MLVYLIDKLEIDYRCADSNCINHITTSFTGRMTADKFEKQRKHPHPCNRCKKAMNLASAKFKIVGGLYTEVK